MKTPFETVYKVYMHLDKDNRPLYVGCGVGNRPYTRARNAAWRNRTNNGQDFEVVIVSEHFNRSDALHDERWLIGSLISLGNDLVNERLTGKRGVKSPECRHPRFVRYSRMRAQAHYRGEGFELRFEQYLNAWGDDVPVRGKVFMARIDPNRAWSVTNVQVVNRLAN